MVTICYYMEGGGRRGEDGATIQSMVALHRMGFAVALLLLTVGSARSQRPASADGAIAGTLTSVDLGQPIRRAVVKLLSTQPSRVRTTTTDANGGFRFGSLPAGDYTLSAAKAGFLESVFGARRPGAGVPGTTIHLAHGQRLDTIAMQLPRGGVISGIITDEFGDPALGVPVRAMRLGYTNGERLPHATATATTDDLGAYRLPGLLPGDYIVSAVPRDSVAAQAATDESLRAREAEIAASGRAVPQVTAERTVPSSKGYVPVYFGSTVSPAAAARVPVSVGQHIAAIDIQLQATDTSTLRGTVVNPDGSAASAQLQLVDPSMPIANLGVWFRNGTSAGKFSFMGLAPGTYVLHAQSSARDNAGVLTGSATMAVDAEPVDVVVTLRPGVTVSGSIDTATVKPPVNVQKLRVLLEPIQTAGDWEGARYEDAPEADGSFTIRGVPPGRYRVEVAGLPAGWALDSAVFGDRDAADIHLLVERGDNAGAGLLKLVARTAEIAGAVTTTAGEPAPNSTVIVFPADRSHRVPRSRRIQVVQPAPDGRYIVRGLPPGEYRIAVVDSIEAGQQVDPGFLAQIEADALPVRVTAGDSTKTELRIR